MEARILHAKEEGKKSLAATALFLVNNHTSGAEIRLARLFCHLYRRDRTVYLITHHDLFARLVRLKIPLGELQDRILFLDHPQRRSHITISPLTCLKWTLVALRLARKHRFRAIYLSSLGIVIGGPLSLCRGISTCVAYTSPSLGEYGGLAISAQIFLWLNLCDHIDALNPTNDLHRWVVNKRKIRNSPNSFTDLSRFSRAHEERRWVVWAGRLEPVKNPFLFVETVAKALPALGDSTDVEFYMLGDGSLREALRQRIDSLGLTGRIRLMGHVDDVEAFLTRSIIFCSTQLLTNYPSQSLLEAMAAKNAVIVTDVGDTRRLVDESCGLLVDGAAGAATALTALLSDDALRRSLADLAYERVSQSHTVETFIEHFEALSVPTRNPV